MVTSNHFIIEMLQAIKIYHTKIKKTRLGFCYFQISLLS